MDEARTASAAPGSPRRSRPRRRLTAGLAALALLAICASALPGVGGRATAAPARPPIMAYRGLGVWVDLFDSAYWNDPAGAVAGMAAHGVRTLFIETSNFHWPSDLNKPDALSQFITQAHAHGMKVVAWYLPQLKDLNHDLTRCKAALQFRTADGQRFDSFGLDIEDSSVKPVSTRSARLLTLSGQLRAIVGSRYPLAAIIPSPTGMTIHSTFWPNFPYKQLAAIYDVMVPMGYYTYHVHGYANVYQETAQNFSIIREQTGDPRIPIHVIGGMAGDSSAAEVQAYVRCVRQNGGLGASLYDYATTKANAWQFLRLIPVNPRPGLPMPAPVGYAGILGNVPHSDSAHPKEVFFDAGTLKGGQVLHYRLYDAQKYEIRLLVNWNSMGLLPAGPAHNWSKERTIAIPASKLNATGATVIAFVARGAFPDWSVWGVRGVSLTPAP
jgi:hypothetical protein